MIVARVYNQIKKNPTQMFFAKLILLRGNVEDIKGVISEFVNRMS